MEKTSTEYTKMRREADVYTESGADYSLPDYNGDIKKVLYTQAAVVPSAKFTEADSISTSGIVNYDIIYLDSENKINHITFTSDYEFPVKIRSDVFVDSNIDTRVSSHSHRLYGPRRISMKASLVSEVRLVERASVETDCAGGDADNLECVKVSLDVGQNLFAAGGEREYADEIVRLEGVTFDEVEVLYSSAIAVAEDVTVQHSIICIKGYFNVMALVKCEGNAPALYKKKIPFDEAMPAEGVKADMSAAAAITVTSVRCNVNADADGCSLTVSLISELGANACGNESVEIVKDAYLKNCECENSYETLPYTTNLLCENHTVNFSETIPISDVCQDGIRDVVIMTANAKVTDVACAGSAATVIGELRLNGICSNVNEEGEQSFFGVKFTLPIKQNVNMGCQISPNSHVECKIKVNDIGASVDGENMYVDAQLDCAVCASADSEVKRLTSCRGVEGGEIVKNASRISVYYPTEGDTLFSVARMFHTSVRTVAADNMLSESVMNAFDNPASLAGIKRLIIK